MARLGSARAGGAAPVLVMGIINASPESFYGASVRTTRRGVAAAAARMERDGAAIIDIGGMSTAPYLDTMIPAAAEAERVAAAVEAAASATSLPISVDTCRAAPARAALERGASIVNDVTGLQHDPRLGGVAASYGASMILCAHARRPAADGGWRETRALLERSVAAARDAGVPRGRLAVDPAIGFFRGSGRGRLFTRTGGRGAAARPGRELGGADAGLRPRPGTGRGQGRAAAAALDWVRRDLGIIGSLRRLRFGYPVVVSVSAKSFIGEMLGAGRSATAPAPIKRIAGSLSCEAAAVLNGANVVRTHNVAATAAVLADASTTVTRLTSIHAACAGITRH